MKVKKYLLKLFTRSSERLSGKTYSQFDEIPAKNWFKYFETQNLDWFTKSGKPTEIQKAQSFEVLFNQQIELFGLSKEFERQFNLKKKIIKLQVDYAISKKDHLLFHLKLKQKQLEQFNPTRKEAVKYLELVAQIEDAKKRSIDENTISAEKFYTYLKQVS